MVVLLSKNFDLNKKVLEALNFKKEVPHLSKSDLYDLKKSAVRSHTPVSAEVLRRLSFRSH
ncbi:hypothetical protein HE1_01165 [Holospora elegans E1]|uniref:Uncharacterized protein n=1 Tax=Holospora elegans E1 TaxID=1427503 RepID=A0A023E052_9PROT|nr:hypothetical protein [Holospora elegans]GAJ46823.1 hypothetical protein HE1_01165 [Holospora elegans E1]